MSCHSELVSQLLPHPAPSPFTLVAYSVATLLSLFSSITTPLPSLPSKFLMSSTAAQLAILTNQLAAFLQSEHAFAAEIRTATCQLIAQYTVIQTSTSVPDSQRNRARSILTLSFLIKWALSRSQLRMVISWFQGLAQQQAIIATSSTNLHRSSIPAPTSSDAELTLSSPAS